MRQGSTFKRCTNCRRNVSDDGTTCAKCGQKLGRSSGNGWSWTFVVDVAPPGAPRKQRMRSGFATKDEALEAMHELQGGARDGTLVEPSKILVREYLTSWLKAYRGEVRGGTWSAAEGYVRNYINPRIGDVPLQALDRQTVKGLYVELRESGRVRGEGGLSAKTVHNVHLALHRALEDAVADGMIARNPAGADRRGKAVNKAPGQTPVDAWTAAELSVFLKAAMEHRLGPLLWLKAYSGMRRGELCGLRWRNVDLDAGTVTVVRQRVKGEDGKVEEVEYGKTSRALRTVDIDPQTVAVLKAHRQAYLEHRAWLGLGKPALDDLVFVGEDGQPLHPDTVSQTFDRIVERLDDVKRITIHGLRHTHGTLMLAAKVALHVVSRRLGHASEAFTARIYAHVLPQQGADAAATFAATVEAVE